MHKLTLMAIALIQFGCGDGSSGGNAAGNTDPTDSSELGTTTSAQTTTSSADSATDQTSEQSTDSTVEPNVEPNSEMEDSTNEPVGSSTDNNNVSGLSRFGYISVLSETPVLMEATFYQTDRTLPLDQIETVFRPSLDSCWVRQVGSATDATPLPDFIYDVSSTTLSAGDVLTVSSAAGSYAELEKIEANGTITYKLSGNLLLTPPLPDGLSVSIPGDELAAVSNIPMPTIGPVELKSPTIAGTVNPSTVFTWNSSGDPDAYLLITAVNVVSDIANISDLKIVSCFAKDDGNFVFPAQTRSEMGESFQGQAGYARFTMKFFQTSDAMLILNGGSRELFQVGE